MNECETVPPPPVAAPSHPSRPPSEGRREEASPYRRKRPPGPHNGPLQVPQRRHWALVLGREARWRRLPRVWRGRGGPARCGRVAALIEGSKESIALPPWPAGSVRQGAAPPRTTFQKNDVASESSEYGKRHDACARRATTPSCVTPHRSLQGVDGAAPLFKCGAVRYLSDSGIAKRH